MHRPDRSNVLDVGGGAVNMGDAFARHAGVKRQAPRFIRRGGFEWPYHLPSEPRCPWKRHATGNPAFVTRVPGWLTGVLRHTLPDEPARPAVDLAPARAPRVGPTIG